MHAKERVFTREERRIAICALVAAGALAMFGMVLQGLMSPSLGPWADGHVQAQASLPGVLEAEPVA